jgi:hypothetical protein
MPLHAEVRRRLADGDFPTWTTFPGGGFPLGTTTDEGLLGPLNLPYRVLPLWYAPGLAKLAELVVALGFTTLFLRQVGLGRPAALLGGFVYALSGFQVVWTNWPQAHVGALIPALLWSVERTIQKRSVVAALPVPLVTAAMVFEGFPSVAGYTLVGSAAYAVTRLVLLTDVPARRRFGLAALLIGSVSLGIGLTSLQTLPLAERASILELGYREQGPDSHLPTVAAATLAVPDALGSPVDGTYFGPSNYVETQSFIGASALVLVTAAAAWPARGLVRGARGFLWVSAAVTGLALYVGGPLLQILQTSSLFRLNNVSRVRSVFGLFLACLAAIGLQAVLDRGEGSPRRWRTMAAWVGAGLAGALGLYAVWGFAADAGQGGHVLRESVLPLAAGGGTAALVWLSRRVRLRGVPLAALAIPVLFAAEALAFARPFWPRVDRAVFYPSTPAHAELEARLGRDRLVGAQALLPGTSTFYQLRSLTTNNPLPQLPTWEDLVRTADPAAFDHSPVIPSLAPREEVATSPVLDRLSVRYFATKPTVEVFGSRLPVQEPWSEAKTIGQGHSVRTEIPGGRIRAVVVRLSGAEGVVRGSRVVAELRDRDEVLSRGYQLLFREWIPGSVQIPVIEPPCPDVGCPARYSLELRLEGPGRVTLNRPGSGPPPLTVIEAREDDGLRLDVVENLVGYRRLQALPRIRWAARARVVSGADARVEALANGVPSDEVILSRPGPAASGLPANVEVREDGGDIIRVAVEAAGSGYLVVADPLLPGWVASMDGRPARLRAADHGLAAVFVPEGEHIIVLRHDPPGWRLGLALSGASASILVLGTVVALVGRKPSTRPAPRAMLSGTVAREGARD